MNTLFDDLQEGLLQAIDYAKGDGPATSVKVHEYDHTHLDDPSCQTVSCPIEGQTAGNTIH